MVRNKSQFQIAREKAQLAVSETNKKIEELGANTGKLYNALIKMQEVFDKIRNVPNDDKLEYEKFKKIRLNWNKQVEKIEKDYKKTAIKTIGGSVAGIGTGVAVAALGPTAAMGIATTFGVASTGTAISALSGAAATNAALAWIGGGALAVGGSGIAGGEVILGLAGPVGWTIAGVAILFTGIVTWKNISDKKTLENIFTLISLRDIKSYQLAIVELNERIKRIKKESKQLEKAYEDISKYGLDYDKMSEKQQDNLGTCLNLIISSTQLLVNPILGLQPKFNENDFEYFEGKAKSYKDLIISLANIFYSIKVTEEEKKILYKSFKNNKTYLNSFNLDKKDFTYEIFEIVFVVLENKYRKEKNKKKKTK